jgi:hypothetical protein
VQGDGGAGEGQRKRGRDTGRQIPQRMSKGEVKDVRGGSPPLSLMEKQHTCPLRSQQYASLRCSSLSLSSRDLYKVKEGGCIALKGGREVDEMGKIREVRREEVQRAWGDTAGVRSHSHLPPLVHICFIPYKHHERVGIVFAEVAYPTSNVLKTLS